ncbi:MAG: molybdopterin-dependent oxidoreductase [Planctomycetes bacterium]|nr:molybdopterin-dependent oxidoreductase [Planctomycetota bacterium]
MSATTRRGFLAKSVLGGGAAFGLSSLLGARSSEAFAAEVDRRYDIKSGDWIPSCCNMCGGQTGILCQVVDGRLVRIKPNDANPAGFSNISDDFFANCRTEGASMCPKGNAGIMTLYDPDRLARPVRRTNPKKGIGVDPGWTEISWEEAYSEIARRMKALLDAGTPEALLWWSEDHSFTHIQGDFCQLFGTPNYSNHSNLCDTARKASFKAVTGDERPLMDAIQSRYILLFGWNPLGATKWSLLPRILTRGQERGAKLVVVDPYFSATARKAQEWIPIRPSTDGAMALAMAHVIIRDGLYDKKFVEEWTHGFDRFSDYVKDKTPAWAEKISTVPAGTIERIAREFATTQPSLADVWSGPGQHSNAVHGGAAIACLNALTGSYDRPGTLHLPNKKGNAHGHLHADKPKAPRFADDNKLYPMFHGSGVYCEIFKKLAEGTGNYPAKMGMIVFQNPMMSVPGTETVAKALSNLEFLVVNDIFLSETAQFADIVVPGTLFLERYDWNTQWVTWPVLALRQPVVKPIFGQPAEYEFICELGRRLGLRDQDGKEFFRIGALSGRPVESLSAWYEEYLSSESKNGAPKMTLEEIKALPGATWVDKGGTKYEKYRKEMSTEDLAKATCVKTQVGGIEVEQLWDKPKDQGGKKIGTRIGGKAVKGFATPTGKVEFVLTCLTGKKDAEGKPCADLPVYEPRDWQPDAQYPLYLINWKEATHTHSRTQNNRWLLELQPGNPLQVNTKTGARLGLRDGDQAWVESKFGKMKVTVHLTEEIHPEVVGTQHGFGHWALGEEAKGRGSSDSGLRPTRADPIGGQAMHKQCCVRIYRA